jgi:hypothetical protein
MIWNLYGVLLQHDFVKQCLYWIATVLSTVDVLLKTRMGVNGKERSTSIYVKSGEKNKALYFLGL